MPKLTEVFVAGIAVPEGKAEIIVFDAALPGFGVRKLVSGRATYMVKYEMGGRQRKVTLGVVVPGKCAEMRQKAADILSKARLGRDTAGELKAAAKARSVATMGELIPRFLKAKEGASAEYHYQLSLFLNRYWQPLHKFETSEIERRHIVLVLDKLADVHGKVGADRAKSALSVFFAWTIERGYRDANPASNISKRADGGSRERVLNEAELAAVWNACDDGSDYSRIVRLLILTGQRREEIGGLLWPEINLEKRLIELPPARTKNRRPHLVPLSDQAVATLADVRRWADRDFVFGSGKGGYGGWSKSKLRIDGKLAGMAPWTPHDLRRTFVTMISEQGFAPPHIVEALVNHISGHKAGVAGIYNRAVYAAEKRQAMDLWGAHVSALVSGDASNVVALRR